MTNYKLWVTQFGYTGRLRVGDLVELRGRLKESCKGKPKKEKKVGLAHLDGWMKMSQKRHEGEAKATEERREKAAEERKRKEEAELEKRLEAMMLRRQEDDESRPPNRRRPVEDEASDPESGKEDTALGEIRPKDRPRTSQNPFRPLQPLYPIRELNQASAPPVSPPPVSPPPYQHTQPRTRDKGSVGEWSKTLGGVLSPTKGDWLDSYPIIEVASGDTDHPIQLVYRTWTAGDVIKATEGITKHKEDVGEFLKQMEELRKSYHLHGVEIEQAYRATLGIDWHRVAGNWNPMGDDNGPLTQGGAELDARVAALQGRIKTRFSQTMDSTALSKVKQGEDEPWPDFRVKYEQAFRKYSGITDDGNAGFDLHLKNGLSGASLPRVRAWVEKHVVGRGE